eukprot:sb/3463341/
MSVVRPNIKLTKTSGGGNAKGPDYTKLPSHQYRHVNYSDLKEIKVKGPQLRGPRIRATPSVKDPEFDEIPETTANYQPHIFTFSSQQEKRAAQREVKEVTGIKSKVEDWENITHANFSFQELGQMFQTRMLKPSLRKLIRCESLILIDNRLSELTELTLPCLTELNLSLNLFTSFGDLPTCPRLVSLNVSGNRITGSEGIEKFKLLAELKMKMNPFVWKEPKYRLNLFEKCPSLIKIDEMTRECVSDLKEIKVKGPQLRGPRIRATPSVKDPEFDEIPETTANYQPHIFTFSSQQEKRAAQREVKEVTGIKSKVEDWENITHANFSFQELGQMFQTRMLKPSLRKLIRCESLILIDNRLSELTELTLPCLTELNLSLNLFTSFGDLPTCPRLVSLNVSGNRITGSEGIEKFKLLAELKMKMNPFVWKEPKYRLNLFEKCPSLIKIDEMTRECVSTAMTTEDQGGGPLINKDGFPVHPELWNTMWARAEAVHPDRRSMSKGIRGNADLPQVLAIFLRTIYCMGCVGDVTSYSHVYAIHFSALHHHQAQINLFKVVLKSFKGGKQTLFIVFTTRKPVEVNSTR